MTIAVDTASTPASGDTTAQENPPAMIKKIGGMAYIVRVCALPSLMDSKKAQKTE